MMTKNECRNFINERKNYLNLTTFCKDLGIARPHLTMFLKADYYDHYLNVEKANNLVNLIKEII